jgi:hypothetical protein
MAEIKRKAVVFGIELEVTEVPIVSRSEIAHEYTLEDGTIIRVATPTMAVFKVESQIDAEGNPFYYVKNGTSVAVIAGPTAKGGGHNGHNSS